MTDYEFHLRLLRRARTMEPDLAREMLRGYEELRRQMSAAELERLIRTAGIDRIVSDQMSDEAIAEAFARLRAELQETYRKAALRAAFDTPRPPVAFNVLDPRVIDAIRALDSRVMRALSESVRETFRQEVADGLAAGVNPRTIANRSLETIGLAPNQAAAVRRFREELETGDRAALQRMLQRGVLKRPDGSLLTNRSHAQGAGLTVRQMEMLRKKLGREPLTAHQIETLTKSYQRRLQAWNVESNARTAALDSLKLAQRQNWENAIERGIIARSELFRRWVAVGGKTGDGRNRPEHLEMHGEEAHIDSPYSNGQTTPGDSDFNCRCGERFFRKRAALAA